MKNGYTKVLPREEAVKPKRPSLCKSCSLKTTCDDYIIVKDHIGKPPEVNTCNLYKEEK